MRRSVPCHYPRRTEPDGANGFVYSVDWDGKPIVRERVRWPIVEAMGTACALTLAGDSV